MALVGLVSGTAGAAVPAPMAPVIGWMAIRPETTLVAPTVLANAGAAFEPTTVLPVEVRPVVALPAAPVIVESVAATAVETPSTGRSLRGNASWYCNYFASRGPISSCMARHPDGLGRDLYAAAGPRLRVAMGGGLPTTAPDPWRNRVVTVSANDRSVRVRLADWCFCYHGQAQEKIIDLYRDVWDALGIPRGSNQVTISW